MSFVNKSTLALLILVVLAACAPPATPTPIPYAAYVGTTPAYNQWVDGWVQTYWEQQPGNGITPLVFPIEAALAAMSDGEIELIITAATPPQGWFATRLFGDAIALLIDPALKLNDLNLDQLYDIFQGRVENWDALGGPDQGIQPIIPLQGDEIRTVFQDQVLKGARYTSNALLAPHPSAALELVKSQPGAIALIPLTSVPATQDVLKIEGIRPAVATIESGRYALTLDILAIAPEEPIGPMRQFLGWLQATLLPES